MLDNAKDDIGGLNLYAYCDNNPVSGRDDDGNMSFWKKLAIAAAVVVAVAVVAAVVTVATGGTATAALCAVGSTLYGAAKGAVIGAVTGAVSGAVTGAVTGAVEGYQEDGWDGVLAGAGRGAWKGAVQGAQDGLLSGMVMGGIGGAMNPSFCFVAGTSVLTAAGHRAIEDIKVGDLVPCVDHITGEHSEKRVVSTTVKKTDTLVDLVIGGDSIRTTTTHPFQVKDKGWVDAGKLQVGDLIYDKDWNAAPVEKVEIITLSEPVEVYNFEVEDCHTYYVGDNCWLVHNAQCHLSKEWRTKRSNYWKEQARTGGSDTWYDINEHDNLARMLKGKAPIGYDDKRVVLHHVEGISKNMDNFIEMGADVHRAFHNMFGYKGFIDPFVL